MLIRKIIYTVLFMLFVAWFMVSCSRAMEFDLMLPDRSESPERIENIRGSEERMFAWTQWFDNQQRLTEWEHSHIECIDKGFTDRYRCEIYTRNVLMR